MAPPGWAGKPVHNSDTAKVEQYGGNTRWFYERISGCFQAETKPIFTLRADDYAYSSVAEFSSHFLQRFDERSAFGKVLLNNHVN